MQGMVRCLVSWLLIATVHGYAQPCPVAPAACPDKGSAAWGTPDDSISRLHNPVLPQEIRMENNLRRQCNAIVALVCEQHGWTWAEISESAADGYRSPGSDELLPYGLRPPHWIAFTYQLIVHKDSLQAWKAWQEDFVNRRLSANSGYVSDAASSEDKVRANMDSANYYGQLKAQYMSDHMAQYQQALMSNNKAASKAYEKEMSWYDQRINSFTNKGVQAQKNPSGETSQKDFEEERRKKTIAFRDATVLLVEFGFNRENAGTAGERIPAGAGTPATAAGNHDMNMVAYFRNRKPDLLDAINTWTHSQNLALWLIGPWAPRPDADGSYMPAYKTDRKRIDQVSNKEIKCDQVQAIDIHLSGNRGAMREFISSHAADPLKKWIDR